MKTAGFFNTPLGGVEVQIERGAITRVILGLAERSIAPARDKRDSDALAQFHSFLEAYLAGNPADMPRITPDFGKATPFQLDVWRKCAEIPFGRTKTYAQIAAETGRPKACRAVGNALGANPVPLLIPCHRVIGADGSLLGFKASDLKDLENNPRFQNARSRLRMKTRLLAHEGVVTRLI